MFVPLVLHPNLSNADLRGVPDAETRITLQQAQAQLQNNARSTLLQGLAGLILVAGAIATWRQVQISRHGQITDRTTRAIEQLASDSIHVRIGGLYALERVAKDSSEDRPTITKILTAFIRNRSPWTTPPQPDHQHTTPALDDGMQRLGLRAEDVQMALYILGDRPRPGDERPLYLSFADLRIASLAGRDLRRLICRDANLAGAWLQRAQLDDAYLTATDLRRAHLGGARLVNARLTGAHLQGADLQRADLRGADLTGACLDGADLTGVHFDQRTRWPMGFNPDQLHEPPASS
ncbi:pentapeptide repeat-containing protein [Micromonospora sp. STR1_7]|uniref:Pentapeptide repeat-containing protein n=2 Tax=Micromonospora parastrephiae TaxID=2806101 RepID=A0ABS1XR03_9ACTN|nr:pentapeptide repeat-containing protein [Micromonospora parastrephiae]